MTLSDYLSETGTTDAAFARTLGVRQSTVWRWKRGDRIPRPHMARQIMAITDGKVRPDDFFGEAA